jgi:maleate cis-trans isomerase
LEEKMFYHGWRARLGVLVPSLVTATEPEFYAMVPEGVTCHFQRFLFQGGGLEQMMPLKQRVIDAADLVSHVSPAAVAMCCTAGSFAGGKGYDTSIAEALEEKTGVPATTASSAALDALRSLGVNRVALTVPYLEELAKAEEKFLEDNGIEVVSMKYLNEDRGIPGIPYERTYDLAQRTDTEKAEAVFISCVGLHTVGLIDKLEQDLGKPVISSNQVTLWKLLRLAGIRECVSGYGKLLSM